MPEDCCKTNSFMSLGSLAGRQCSHPSQDQHSATIARKSVTRHLTVRRPRFVANVPRKVIIIKTASTMLFRSVYLVEVLTNRSAEAAVFYTHAVMSRTFQILQLNVGKREMVQLSLLNDDNLKDFGVLAISEPYSWRDDHGTVVIPIQHHNWTKLIPTAFHDGRWPIRSMLWIRSDLDARQMAVDSADITAASLSLPDQSILIVSVYVPHGDLAALQRTLQLIQQLIHTANRQTPTRLDILVVGDFNRHDHLWGGHDVSLGPRQGEADPIVNFISDFSLHSLLPRGTKTWARNGHESTIDLVFASDALAVTLLKCGVHEIEHGSDHRAITTTFDIEPPERPVVQRLLIKNAPWNAIRERITTALQNTPLGLGTQAQTDHLMTIVQDAIYALTPKAKPSPYAKRWWTSDLTNLRRTYTYQRNQARAQRRIGPVSQSLE